MNKYAKQAYFWKVTAKKGSVSFCNTIKSFLTNKRTLEENVVAK